ncbi:MAG: hypothetical protein JNK05_28050 [Myxococcales bacterium]|nr:hypothetical protein [Myxococcales bacterium]
MTRIALGAAMLVSALGGCGSARPQSEPPAVRARLLATFNSTACAIDERDRLYCWGFAPVDGGVIATSPTLVTTAPGAVELAVFGGAYCVRTDDGVVSCGGANELGQLGDEGPSRGELRAVPGVPLAKSLLASARGFCVLSREDELWCWGYANQRGPTGGPFDVVQRSYRATRITQDRFERVVGRGTVCASGAGALSNRVFCEDASAIRDAPSFALVEVRTLPPLPLLYAARGIVCVGASGQAACNELLANSQASALRVGIPQDATLAHVDPRVRCVLRRGELRCSSRGTDGNIPLLIDSADDSGYRRAATPPLASAAIEFSFGCGLETNGAIVCWGSDYAGQLGQGRARFTPRPMRVSGLSGVREMTINGGRFERNLSVVFADERGLFARQNNGETELEPLTGPRGAPFSNSFVDPIVAPAPRSVLTTGTTVCGLFDDGRLRCSPTEGRWTEPFGAMTEGASAYAFDWQTFCRLTLSGRVECIAHPTSSERPRDVPELANARAIASGYERVCAITAERTVRCLVRRVIDTRGTVETRVETAAGIDDATHIFSSGRVVCVTRSDGALYCWGQEWVAGRATSQPLEAPTRVEGVRDVRSMAISSPSLETRTPGYACAVDSAGAVYCWGRNTLGECASSGGRFIERPTRVEGLTAARSVVSNSTQTCAVLESGDVWCWGMTTATSTGGIGSIYTLDRPVRVALPTE